MSTQVALNDLEIRSLNRVGIYPQNIPTKLDHYIQIYLWEKAEINVVPADSSSMMGSGTAAFATGFMSGIFDQGGASMGTSITAGNIKKQTGVQEWIHWKKHALDQSDFESYRNTEKAKYEKMLEVATAYIRSEKGKICCRYETMRPAARFIVVFISVSLLYIGWIGAPILNYILMKRKGVTLPEWVIQKILRVQSFASIRPTGRVTDEGVLELEY